MREILFRGICTETGDWVKGHYVRLFDDKGNRFHRIYPGYAESDCGDLYPDWYEVDPETVGQFTGLTDKNGTKIFEGDILKFHKFKGEPDWLGFVRYDISMFVIEGEQPVDNGGFEVQLCSIDRKRCEIIGNIHDNPELLEEA